MTAQEPILFYDLIACEGSPYFSPFAIKARLAFALKRVPIHTVEVTYQDLLHEWKDKLEVKLATVPFIRKPDGEYLMDSSAIVNWLEATYPDQPSIVLPEAALPVDRQSEQYQLALDRKGAEWSGMNPSIRTMWNVGFDAFAPTFVNKFDPATQAYWTSEERMGPGEWQNTLDADQEQVIAECRAAAQTLSKLLSAEHKFFSSATRPGLKDITLMGPWRFYGSTSPELVRRIMVEGGLGEWLERMEGFFGRELAVVTERDPK